ncbi:MAG: IS30 family transposase [Uliginosibacterium sp.]|nr:IS30 family transposase [Uliginosibacterium sp.]
MSFAHLNQHQRYQIEKQLAEGKSVAVIARSLGIHRSTVYRELRRGQLKGRYSASTSHQRALGRREKSAANHRQYPRELWQWVRGQLKQEWSPQQISGRLRLCENTGRCRLSTRRSMTGSTAPVVRSPSTCATTANPAPGARAAAACPRGGPASASGPRTCSNVSTPGTGKATPSWDDHASTAWSRWLSARASTPGYRPPSPSYPSLSPSTLRTLTPLSARTLTLDNGTEFAAYAQMGLPVYFADPGRPRQRSRNENTNGLIRQYIPKGANLRKVSAAKVRHIEQRLNNRPRKTLGYLTPNEVLFGIPPTPVAIRT